MQIQKFLHILNPNSRYRNAVKKFFDRNPHLTHVWVERTSHPTHLETIVEWGLLQGKTNIAVWGGDGSFNRVVQSLFAQGALSKCTLALVPAGTGNDFARNLNVSYSKKYLRVLFSGESFVEKIDVGTLEQGPQKRIFMNNAGFGRTPAALQTAHPNPLRDILSFQEKKIEVECEDGAARQFETTRVYLGIVFNSPYFNKGLYFDKQISPVDGILQAVLIPPQNRWKLFLRFVLGRLGCSLAEGRDRSMAGKVIRVESDQLLYPQVDGEPAGQHGVQSLQFSVLEKGLNLLIPKTVQILNPNLAQS